VAVKTLALCINLQDVAADPRNKALCEKYPGSGFVPHLVKAAEDAGWVVKSGKDALADVVHGSRNEKDTWVLQEECNPEGLKLLELGATPGAVFCMESKMYAPRFYDAIPHFKKLFPRQILFEQGTDYLYFPSYDHNLIGTMPILSSFSPWHNRKPLCMISSNKQWWSSPHHPWDSPSYCQAIRNELHTARLQAIANNPDMDLYGFGWDNLGNIPPQWDYLKPQIQKQWRGVVDNKLETLSKYKFTICLENVNLPGYVTEKTIHARLASCQYPGCLDGEDIELYSYQAFAKTVFNLMHE
jgi:hypothetical protein